jgi:hypothetical protein
MKCHSWLWVLLCACLAGNSFAAEFFDDDIELAQAEGTLPPVEVRPAASGDYQQGYAEGFRRAQQAGYGATYGQQVDFFGQRGAIPWNSDAIQFDNDLVGPYAQPQWTTQRPYSTTRTYVLPAGQMQVEQWVRPTYPRGGKPEYRFLTEYAVGLPGRFQLDVYERWNVEPDDPNNNEHAHQEGTQIELRYALADWGVIPFNPTLYAEWVERGGPQDKANKYEIKLLLAEQITDRLFYASNFIMEQEVEDERENELGWSNAISTPIIDRKLMGGIECLWSGVNSAGARNTRTNEFTIGPSLQYRFTNRWYLTSTALFGTTSDAPACQCYFIMGYQFGNRAGPANYYAPASTIGN